MSPVTSPAQLLSFSLYLLVSSESQVISAPPVFTLNVKAPIDLKEVAVAQKSKQNKKMSLSIDRGSCNIKLCNQQIWWTWLLFLISLSHVVCVSQTEIARPVDLQWDSDDSMILNASSKSVILS